MKDGKKHQVGPLTYKNVDPTMERVDQRNNAGKFHGGILKSGQDQTCFINACRAAASERPQVGKYTPKFDYVDVKSKKADFNRDPNPQRGLAPKFDKKEPGPQTYQLEKKDERVLLSTKKRSIDYRFYPGNKEAGKMNRFMDHHIKKVKGSPAPTKYSMSIEKMNKYISPSPNRLAHKR